MKMLEGIELISGLTPLQQGMLFHTRYASGSAVYNIQLHFTLEGELDDGALERAWRTVLERHTALRTSFVWERVEKPYQLVHHHAPLEIERHDWRALSEGERSARMATWLEGDRARVFDLTRPPLMRLALIGQAGRRFSMVWTFHHIILEGWSAAIVLGEFWKLYGDLRAGRSSGLPPVQPYQEYILWLQRQDQATAETYWRRTLKGFGAPTRLPIDRSVRDAPPAVKSVGACSLTLAKAFSDKLKSVAKTNRVTLNTIVQGAWAILLSRYAGEPDVVFGAVVSGRPAELPGAESTVGLFVNTLPARVMVNGDEQLMPWLRELQLGQAEMRQYEYSSLMQVQAWSDVPAGKPLFHTVLAFENWLGNFPSARVAPDLRITKLESPMVSDQPLSLIVDMGEALRLTLAYDIERFERAPVECMLEHLHTLLKGMATGSNTRLKDLPLLSHADRRKLLLEWNDTKARYPAEACVHELFEAQARRTPEAVALEFAGRRLCYRELSERADHLARHLRSLGVGPDVLVGLYLERSVEMVVGLLGILKAGGAYVPLDPAYPAGRLAFMLEDTRAPVVVTESRLAAGLPDTSARIVCLDRDWAKIEAHGTGAVAGGARARNLAYVIYTSGSTGTPKGVAVTHRAINRLVCNTDYIDIERSDRFAQASVVSFDAATFEIWGALLNGAQLVGVSREVLLNPRDFAEFLRTRGITVLFLTTALFNQMAREAPGAFRSLRCVLFGGELVDPDMVRAVLRDGPPEHLLHVYGPTEVTTFSTWHRVTRLDEAAVTVPIGRPIANTTAYVLDQDLRPVPVGVPGELYLGGDGVARGYLNRPELTAERFFDHPFSKKAGDRLYRTGDWVRYLPDGAIEFIGRRDNQVKVRGFRIELGEIEAALMRVAPVQEAVVMVREDQPADKRVVAYVVPRDGRREALGDLRSELRQRLPEYMVPAAFVVLSELPLTLNGKVDRKALPAPERSAMQHAAYVAPRSDLQKRIAAIFGEVLQLDQVGLGDNFFDLGGHSLLLLKVHGKLREAFDQDLSIVDLFEFPTVDALARRLGGGVRERRAFDGVHERISKRKNRSGAYQPIAIVGMAGRYPDARDPETLWRNICAGKEFVTAFSDDELRAAGVSEELLARPNYVKSGVILEDVESFDARFFGYTPREAQLLDPQQRVFLECAWEALEKSGCDPSRYSGAIGVFAGIGQNSYLQLLSADPVLSEFLSGVEGTIAGDKDFVATRVSYKLGLKGPSLTVQTACSTSLVAVHVAARSLQEYECDMALAGGVSIVVPQVTGYLYHSEGIGSPDGHCRVFDAKAAGTMNGNGASVVVLKRLEDALADGDMIHAVIKGSAINNDGAGKVGFTAPSIEGQAEVIAAAHAEAAVDAATIGYVEAHGTGTRLGDPVEVAALTQAFRGGTDKAGYCGLGSIKSNLGHLNTAAGCTGLIKAALAVRDGVLPPSLHFDEPNPEIDFANTPFYVNTVLTPWKEELRPRRAGVSSFGIGGTNAHVVLEEAPAMEPSGPSRRCQLLVLSARTEKALEASASLLAAHLEENPDQVLADVAYTLQVGRREFDWRAVALCRDVGEARTALTGRGEQRLQKGRVKGNARPVVFMFPGQGSQYPGMGEGLYRDDARYRQVVDECCEILQHRAGIDLKAVLYPTNGQDKVAAERLRDTQYAQPALFVTEYALARRWMAWGMAPEAMIGHSVGEYVAACQAGVMSLEDALMLVATRGRLVSRLEGGAMLAVPLGEPEVQSLLGDSLSIAAINSPQLCVVSGPTPAVRRLESELRDRGLEPVQLHTSHAFHSKMMDPALAEFARCVSQVKLHAPRLPYISNLSGTWVTADQATDVQYWVDHLRQGVRFSAGIQKLLEDDSRIFLEVGPGNTLAGIVRQHVQAGAPSRGFGSLRAPRDTADDEAHLLDALGKLWLAGVAVDWRSLSGTESRRRVPLPTYPFERQKHWVGTQRRRVAVAPLQRKPDIADWFYSPAWARSVIIPSSPGNDGAAGPHLVFVDHRGLGERLVRMLVERGETVVEVREGQEFAELEPGRSYSLRPASAADYAALCAGLRACGRTPRHVIHLWGVEAVQGDGLAGQQRCQELGFYSLLFLAQALGADNAPLQVSVVTEGAHAVGGNEALCPEKALVMGPCRVIPDEFPNVACRNLDVVIPDGDCGALAATLLSEFGGSSGETVVAYRGGERWIQSFQPVRLPSPAGVPARLRHGGVYLITGGLGGIGLAIAGYLARSVQAKLVLVNRSSFPAPENWVQWLAEHDGEEDVTSRRIRQLQVLKAEGAEVLVLSADVTDEREVGAVVERVRARFGRIHGIVHAAGLGGGGIIQLKSRTDAATVMSPKVEGMRVLQRVLKAEELDFVALCSSLTSILGGAGRVEYCAANACLDAYPASNRQRGGPPTVAINWDTWSDVGMAVEAELPDVLAAHRERALRMGITVEEGIEVFRRVLAAEPALPQVLVSTRELGGRFPARGTPAELPTGSGLDAEEETLPASEHHGTRPANLSRVYAAPRNSTDKTLADIWQDLMGIDSIGIDDDFFELGGHSLLAIQVLGRANTAFGVKVTLQELFSAPTVAGLSAKIEALRAQRGPEYGKIAELAENLEQYSEEDIRRIVAESRASGPGPRQEASHEGD